MLRSIKRSEVYFHLICLLLKVPSFSVPIIILYDSIVQNVVRNDLFVYLDLTMEGKPIKFLFFHDHMAFRNLLKCAVIPSFWCSP